MKREKSKKTRNHAIIKVGPGYTAFWTLPVLDPGGQVKDRRVRRNLTPQGAKEFCKAHGLELPK